MFYDNNSKLNKSFKCIDILLKIIKNYGLCITLQVVLSQASTPLSDTQDIIIHLINND